MKSIALSIFLLATVVEHCFLTEEKIKKLKGEDRGGTQGIAFLVFILVLMFE